MNEYEMDTWFDQVMRASTSQSYHQVTKSSFFCELRCGDRNRCRRRPIKIFRNHRSLHALNKDSFRVSPVLEIPLLTLSHLENDVKPVEAV